MNKLRCNFRSNRLAILAKCPALLLLGAGVMALALDASAVGFRLPNQDPEAIARGNAFAATADNPSAIYYNPAGITQLEGQQFRVGMYFISADTHYKSPGGATAETRTDFQPVPQMYYVRSLKELPLSFGLGVYAPYGLGLDWGSTPPFRNLAASGKLLYATINPVIAWKIDPTLSIAIGPTINYSKAVFKRGIGLAPGDLFKYQGEGSDYGFNAGLRWQPSDQWAFGVNYRSPTTINYNGRSATSPTPPFPSPRETHAAIHFPQFAAVGVSYRPTENWNFEVNVDWTDWDNVNRIVFHGTAGGDQVFPLNFRSGLMYEFGITRQLGHGYFISTGYIYSENSSPDRNFNPIIPDSDLHLGSIGFGHRGKRWDWAVGYHFAFNPGRDVKNSVPGGLADGNYRTFNNAFNLSTTYKF